MKLTFDQLKDKILGCWDGKNAGGVLGAPLEGHRGVSNVEFYLQDLDGNPPPNDDLDLQIVWLSAVDKYGRQVNSHILSEYWLSYIIPDWVEYGTGKNNLRTGMLPPLTGHISNAYRNSCGCFIRSEIWACLCAGHPELAARYAFEDAIVDHSEEGMYAEVFCAAIQSAAFVESDRFRLIEIGLSYIPKDCAIAKAVQIVMDSYQKGLSYLEAREILLTELPSSFGLQFKPIARVQDGLPLAEPGYDAPANIGIMIIGWLYGEDDFGKSICIAVNCGEDTDCTAATLGAIFGIIHGRSGLPKKWLDPLGDVINTCCINRLASLYVPQTVTELSDWVLRIIPGFLGHTYCDTLYSGDGYTLITDPEDQLMCPKEPRFIPGINGGGYEMGSEGGVLNGNVKPKELPFAELLQISPYAVKFDFTTFYAVLDYHGEPTIRLNETKTLTLSIYDSGLTCHQQWINVKIYGPEGITIAQGKNFSAPLQNTYLSKTCFQLDVTAEQILNAKTELLIDISMEGRHTYGVVKAILYAGN